MSPQLPPGFTFDTDGPSVIVRYNDQPLVHLLIPAAFPPADPTEDEYEQKKYRAGAEGPGEPMPKPDQYAIYGWHDLSDAAGADAGVWHFLHMGTLDRVHCQPELAAAKAALDRLSLTKDKLAAFAYAESLLPGYLGIIIEDLDVEDAWWTALCSISGDVDENCPLATPTSEQTEALLLELAGLDVWDQVGGDHLRKNRMEINDQIADAVREFVQRAYDTQDTTPSTTVEVT